MVFENWYFKNGIPYRVGLETCKPVSSIAQWLEPRTSTSMVAGSNPARAPISQ